MLKPIGAIKQIVVSGARCVSIQVEGLGFLPLKNGPNQIVTNGHQSHVDEHVADPSSKNILCFFELKIPKTAAHENIDRTGTVNPVRPAGQVGFNHNHMVEHKCQCSQRDGPSQSDVSPCTFEQK